jgi:mRNA-degrading endonuclease RelE of RelBE toxin-antitoxin system
LTSSSPIYKVITTKKFRDEATALKRKYPNIKQDFLELAEILKEDPITGHTNLGKDCYKIRMQISDKGKGQSGGARLIINVVIKNSEVYILSVYDKGGKETVTDGELIKLLSRKKN